MAAPAAKATAEPPEWSIKVEAIRKGTYPQQGYLNAWVREIGDQFYIKNMKHFAEEWMVLPGQTPPAPTGNELPGHGALPVEPDGVPTTTVPNRVKGPMDLLAQAGAETRGR